MRTKPLVYTLILFLAAVFRLSAQIIPVHEPEIMARSAYVLEVKTGRVLYGKDPDLIWPPASLTKLMTLHLVFAAIENGTVTADDLVPVSAAADWRALPKGSSLMFIESGQLVTVRELMQGLAVSSGNDAAVALAEYLAGSVDEFVHMMNVEAGKLGYSSFHFDDASGFSEKNAISARQFAEFCAIYINKHLKNDTSGLSGLHELTALTYPKPHNIPEGGSASMMGITQHNRNHLLGRMDGITGLKTGYIDESMFNVAISGSMNGIDIIAVILGTPGDLDKSGYMNRTLDSAVLVSWVFNNFSLLTPEVTLPDALTVWYGKEHDVPLKTDAVPPLVLSDNERAEYRVQLDLPDSVKAPVEEGRQLGSWKAFAGDTLLVSVPVYAAAAVERSKSLGLLGDWIKKLFR